MGNSVETSLKEVLIDGGRVTHNGKWLVRSGNGYQIWGPYKHRTVCLHSFEDHDLVIALSTLKNH